MSDISPLTEALIQGNSGKLLPLVNEALDSGRQASEILNSDLIAGMDLIGNKMASGEMFIPEVLMAARTMNQAVEVLKPHLAEGNYTSAGKIVLGTVKGDLHDIGKNLVRIMLESSGFEVIDLGVDVAPEAFVEAVQKNKPDLVGLSALLTTTLPNIKNTIESINSFCERSNLKIIVGGAPVTQAFADEIGADGYAPDAGSASKLVKSCVS
jgi:5-methyltetrahydrofolate--homocysteine methyltransferase